MTVSDAAALADELHAFCAAAPHDYPGHNIELFERVESFLRTLIPVAVSREEYNALAELHGNETNRSIAPRKNRCGQQMSEDNDFIFRQVGRSSNLNLIERLERVRLALREDRWGNGAEVITDAIAEISRLSALPAKTERAAMAEEWQPIDDGARDGREILLRQGIDGPIFAGYFGLASLAYGAGASTMYPWTVLDNTNGVNHMRDGGKAGLTHYRALVPPLTGEATRSRPDRGDIA